MSILEIIHLYRQELTAGALVTLKLVSVVWGIGLPVGALLAMAATRWTLVRHVAGAVTLVLMSVPILVLLFWAHFPAQRIVGIVVDPFYTAAAVLSVLNTAVVAGAVAPALRQFPREWLTMGRVLGLSKSQIVLRIQAPLILRQVGPTLLMLELVMVHATLFASLISVPELFRVVQRIDAMEHAPIPIYSGMAIIFIILFVPINVLAAWLHRRFARDLSER